MSAVISWLCSKENSNPISIPVKTYDTTRLMVSTADINFWSIFVTGVIPVCILLVGFGIWIKRRKQ